MYSHVNEAWGQSDLMSGFSKFNRQSKSDDEYQGIEEPDDLRFFDIHTSNYAPFPEQKNSDKNDKKFKIVKTQDEEVVLPQLNPSLNKKEIKKKSFQ